MDGFDDTYPALQPIIFPRIRAEINEPHESDTQHLLRLRLLTTILMPTRFLQPVSTPRTVALLQMRMNVLLVGL
jgi:hypothetical protein